MQIRLLPQMQHKTQRGKTLELYDLKGYVYNALQISQGQIGVECCLCEVKRTMVRLGY